MRSSNHADMTANTAERKMIDRHMLADRWRCSISTIKRMENRGEIQPMRLGARIVRYDTAHIDEIEDAATKAVAG